MDWIGALCLSAIVPLVMTSIYLFDRSDAARLVAVTTAVNSILIVAFAPMSLSMYARQFDWLWLTAFRSRAHLARTMTALCVGHSVRLAACSIVTVGALSCATDSDVARGAIAFLTLAPATGASLIALSTWFRSSRMSDALAAMATFGGAIALMLVQYELVVSVSQWPQTLAVVGVLAAAGALGAVGIHLAAARLAEQYFVSEQNAKRDARATAPLS